MSRMVPSLRTATRSAFPSKHRLCAVFGSSVGTGSISSVEIGYRYRSCLDFLFAVLHKRHHRMGIAILRPAMTAAELKGRWKEFVWDKKGVIRSLENYRTVLLLRYPPFVAALEKFSQSAPVELRHPSYPGMEGVRAFCRDWKVEIKHQSQATKPADGLWIESAGLLLRSLPVISSLTEVRHIINPNDRAAYERAGYVQVLVDITAGPDTLAASLDRLRLTKYGKFSKPGKKEIETRRDTLPIFMKSPVEPNELDQKDLDIMDCADGKFSLSEIRNRLNLNYVEDAGLSKKYGRLFQLVDPRNVGDPWIRARQVKGRVLRVERMRRLQVALDKTLEPLNYLPAVRRPSLFPENPEN